MLPCSNTIAVAVLAVAVVATLFATVESGRILEWASDAGEWAIDFSTLLLEALSSQLRRVASIVRNYGGLPGLAYSAWVALPNAAYTAWTVVPAVFSRMGLGDLLSAIVGK